MKRLNRKASTLLEKARDSALLAVEVYNKPAVKFKSAGYITLMVIAWTALFHAYFFKHNIKPYYKKKNGRYERREGDFLFWELTECVNSYYKDHNPAERANINFFIPLRNKIEHKFIPEIDSTIFGECQALLINFDNFIKKEFNEKYCLRESLSFALQLYPSTTTLAQAVRTNIDAEGAVNFINNYRSSIDSSIYCDQNYAFKAFLIQVNNSQSANSIPIQFINYEKLNNEQKEELAKFITLIKYKEIEVANRDYLKASQVVKQVQTLLGDPKITHNNKVKDKFNMSVHTFFWKKYQIRPEGKSKDKKNTKQEYCIYDSVHDDYLYTERWVAFIFEKMKDESEYESLFKKLP